MFAIYQVLSSGSDRSLADKDFEAVKSSNLPVKLFGRGTKKTGCTLETQQSTKET